MESSIVTIEKQVDVLFVGGGPATLGILANAIKSGRMSELLQGDGIAIVEAGSTFGGGVLGTYGINSNTSGVGFLTSMYKKSKKVYSELVPVKGQKVYQNMKPKMTKQWHTKEEIEIFAPFKELYSSPIAEALRTFDKQTCPLALVGYFLNCMGNHMLCHYFNTSRKKLFYPEHEVQEVCMVSNGDYLTKV